jgi:YfiH family protein
VVRRGTAGLSALGERPDGDAIVSNVPGLVLAVVVADCVPVLLADARAGAAAAVHAGWRGTCQGVVKAAVEALVRECGSRPDDLLAAIGPSIGPNDYEVGEALLAEFAEAGHGASEVARWFGRTDAGRLSLDLWQATRDQLEAAGVRPGAIFTAGLSTASCPGCFESFRRDGAGAGRMAALVRVPEHTPGRDRQVGEPVF